MIYIIICIITSLLFLIVLKDTEVRDMPSYNIWVPAKIPRWLAIFFILICLVPVLNLIIYISLTIIIIIADDIRIVGNNTVSRIVKKVKNMYTNVVDFLNKHI